MTRLDTALASASLGSVLSLASSANGGSSIRSTSPATRAATRALAFGQRLEDHMRPGGSGSPVAVVARQHQIAAALPCDELERPGADQPLAAIELVGRPAFRRAARRRGVRQDRQVGEIDRQQGRGRAGRDAQGQRIDDLDTCHLARDRGERRRAVGHLGGALEGEDHVFGGEGRAVLELHVRAELELPHRVADRLPRQLPAPARAAAARRAPPAARRC